jgi:FkbM family methyltransferase
MKILYIAPHLSTGGCPQYLLKKIQVLVKEHEVYCVEYSNHGGFTVQRNQIKEILKDRFFELGENKMELMDIVNSINPEVVHLEEMPEYFMDGNLAIELYSKDRKYKLIETSHDSSFNPQSKTMFPDKILFVSKYQLETLKSLDVPMDVCEYPIVINPRKPREEALKVLGLDPNKKHVINVGLFTPRKNQAEIIEYAKQLRNYPIQFHFIGNQADNFKFYWEPLRKDFPPNCTWWDERKDVHNFYQAADLFLFTSRGTNNDKETSPLVIREAISYNIPSLIYNLPVYLGMYDKFENIEYLDFDSNKNNIIKLLKKLNMQISDGEILREPIFSKEDIKFNVAYDNTQNKILFSTNTLTEDLLVSIKELDSRAVIWSAHYNAMPPNSEFWIIPTPKDFIDFEKDPYVGGLLVEFYNKEKLIDSKSIRIKPAIPNKHQSILKNNSEPMYMNYTEFFVDRIYDEFVKNKKFDIVVDVGANIGLWTEYILHSAKCKTVYAIEPNKSALEVLEKSFGDNVTVVKKALSDVDGHIEFFVDSENSTVSSIANVNKNDKGYAVESIKFKTFINQYGIKKVDLMKVDIESGEYPLFSSLDDSDIGIIDNILMEYHTLGGRTYEKDAMQIINKLKSLGFSVSIKNMHPAGGFIYATKNSNVADKRNESMVSFLDINKCPDKRDIAVLVNKLFPDGTGVEIGVLRGDYSKIILERWKHGQMYLIDTWRHLSEYVDMNGQDDKYHYDCIVKTCENIKPWQNRAHMIRMDSALAANLFPDEFFDFVYIDADHSYDGVVRDLKAWWPKVKRGGLFCGDDYIPQDGDIWLTIEGQSPKYAGKFGVRKAVNEFTAKNNLKLYETTNEPYWKQWYTFKPF